MQEEAGQLVQAQLRQPAGLAAAAASTLAAGLSPSPELLGAAAAGAASGPGQEGTAAAGLRSLSALAQQADSQSHAGLLKQLGASLLGMVTSTAGSAQAAALQALGHLVLRCAGHGVCAHACMQAASRCTQAEPLMRMARCSAQPFLDLPGVRKDAAALPPKLCAWMLSRGCLQAEGRGAEQAAAALDLLVAGA